MKIAEKDKKQNSKWIVHFQGGSSIVEDRVDPKNNNWMSLDSKNLITSVDIIHDDGITHTLSIADLTQKGYAIEDGFYPDFFQHKEATDDMQVEASGRIVPVGKTSILAQEVGITINSKGDCVILRVNNRTGQSKIFIDNIFDMGINFQIHGIDTSKYEHPKKEKLIADLG